MIPASCIIIHPATLKSLSNDFGTPSAVDGDEMSWEVLANGCGCCGFISDPVEYCGIYLAAVEITPSERVQARSVWIKWN